MRSFVLIRGLVTCVVATAFFLAVPTVAGAANIDLSIGLGGQIIGQTLTWQVQPALLTKSNHKTKDVQTDLRLDLPSGTVFQSVQNTDLMTCTFDPAGPGGAGSVYCVGSVNFFTNQNIYVTTAVTAPQGSTLTGFAIIDPNNTITEFDETDNTAQSAQPYPPPA
jgi:hypothetical protein